MSEPVPSFMANLSPNIQKWVLEKRSARMMSRHKTPYPEIEAFYNEVRPRLPEMITYLNQFDPKHIPAEALPVLWLSLSVVECARCVELWHANDIQALSIERVRTYRE